MEFPCECDITVQNDNALRFSIVTKPAPIIEYLKAIASVIGAAHILGVFEDGDFIKVYFDDKKHVDTLIRSGIHVMGHHIKVDYVVPPGSKVILSNIDPVISNYDLIRLMSMFGSVVSPVFRLPISDDAELCHIDCGVRYVYMNLNIPVPNALEFKYGDQICKIDIELDDTLSLVPYIKKETIESNTTEPSSIGTPDNTDVIIEADNLNITEPVVVHVQSTTDVNSEQQNETLQLNIGTNNSMTTKCNINKAHLTKLKTSQINKKIKHRVKYRNRKTKRFKISRKMKQIENKASIEELPQTLLNSMQPSSSALSPEDTSTSTFDDSCISKDSKSILNEVELKLFLEEVKCQRAPIELVKKYLGPDFDSNALLCLMEQLNNFKKRCEDLAVKQRVYRLINNLKILNK